MSANADQRIPASVIRRFTRYLAYAQELCHGGVEWVSSQEMAERLGLTSSTVRQDLSHLDFSGISKRGYETTGLCRALEHTLGADAAWSVAVVGAGNLGKALALHEEFARRGFHIRALFDSDPRKIGKRVGKLTVRDMADLSATVRRERVQLGLIAVPAPAAQETADALIAAGVKGLLNLALTHIAAPRGVPVINSRIVSSLLELSFAVNSGA